jgi:hypothetical protein
MKICCVQNINEEWLKNSTETRITYILTKKLAERGHEILYNECDSSCDFILCLNGLSQYGPFEQIRTKYPNIKTIMYVWDLYPWTPYVRGHESLIYYDEIWVPSNEVALRLKEFYNVDPNKCRVIKSYVNFFENENYELKDKYVYHPVRKYKPDPNYGFLEKACTELGIPYSRNTHGLDYTEYKKNILSCAFLVTEYMEASTGGLTLLEGYYHGKQVLLSDSKYQGGRDYFGDRAFYFKDGDYEDFKDKVKFLWNFGDDTNLDDRREFCKQYDIEVITDQIISSLNLLK